MALRVVRMTDGVDSVVVVVLRRLLEIFSLAANVDRGGDWGRGMGEGGMEV